MSTAEQNKTITARERKRKWFQEKYSNASGDSSRSQNIDCKFFSTTGRCRNGDDCPFNHTRGSVNRIPINQPCRYLYSAPFRCNKDSECHFSHDLSSFPCPHSNTDPEGRCLPLCRFNHSPLVTESDRIRFVEVYHSFLISKKEKMHPRWSFYLSEYPEEQVWGAITRKDAFNFFNVSFGSLAAVAPLDIR